MTLAGHELKPGDKAPDFTLVDNNLKPVTLKDTGNSVRIISVVPSLDTPVCDAQTKRFNEEAARLPGVDIVTVSMDLPFAQKRWCGAFGVDKIKMLSACEFRTGEPRQIILAGEKGSADTDALLRTLHSRFVPNRIVLLVDSPETRRTLAAGIASIQSMHKIEGRASAYVCRNYTCQLPVFEAEKLAELLQ